MKWEVTGINKVRNQLVAIKDTVTSRPTDTSEAMRKARNKYPRASELAVKEVRSD